MRKSFSFFFCCFVFQLKCVQMKNINVIAASKFLFIQSFAKRLNKVISPFFLLPLANTSTIHPTAPCFPKIKLALFFLLLLFLSQSIARRPHFVDVRVVVDIYFNLLLINPNEICEQIERMSIHTQTWRQHKKETRATQKKGQRKK